MGVIEVAGDIVAVSQLASEILRACVASQHPDGIQSLQQEVVSLKSTLTALQQRIPTDREALLDDIRLVEQTVSDCRITMEQMMAALRRHENTRYTRGDYMRIGELQKDSSLCRSKLSLWLDMRRCPYEHFAIFWMIITIVIIGLKATSRKHENTGWYMRGNYMRIGELRKDLSLCRSKLCLWLDMRRRPYENFGDVRMVEVYTGDDSFASTTYEGLMESIPTVESWAPMASLSFEWTWIWLMDLEMASRRSCEACLRQQIVSSSTFNSLFRRINAVLQVNAPKTLLLLSPLLFAHSTAAMAADYDSVHNSDSWMRALQCRQVDLVSLWTHPFSNSPLLKQTADPTSLLLATFLGTSTIALVAQAGRNDVFQTRIIGFCALVGAIAAAVMEAGLRDFIFGYLFWGCVVGVKASWIAHRVWPAGKGKEERQVEAGQTDSGKGGN